ncbi:hypothetical protein FOXG_11971 [Fusarium oxysporum f. sp. lycopersici 4287]|uniref:Phenylalanine ammonia-lyase n=2 Tax=Fusarium oxysporum TaxID=5507 RepID=A0A0J9VND9_FUSO4|nr:hypothetical protein FOXG_11971 [Fusarium oxysporum f. sp. lycopersici 4287]KNB12351.1 hypothetical protein FOXG_11971 [Fusarium oxysporum f. sp. lycopersici 4287]
MPLRDTDHLSGCGRHVAAVSDPNRDVCRSTKPSESSHHSPTHAYQTCDVWRKVQSIKDCGFILLHGSDLDVASVIAVANIPVTCVRAAMLIRCNTLLRGHSGVCLELVQALLLLLRKGMTPIVPLRGSISASGDLIPPSYLAGMLEGNPDIRVRTSTSFVLSADKALELAGLEPITLGPKEDLGLVNVELNSASDNPIIDIKSGEVYSGANFISSSVANGMEKSRLALQMVGKLLFSLSSELINPTLNRGLPPNVVTDDPSLSFTTKMCAAHLFAVCQALDLRVLHMTYLKTLRTKLVSKVLPFLNGFDDQVAEGIYERLHENIVKSWNASACFDLQERCKILSKETIPVLRDHLEEHEMHFVSTRPLQRDLENLAYPTFTQTRSEFFVKPPTKQFLGRASLGLYCFVREELGVHFHQGLVEHPGRKASGKANGREKRTIGSWVSIIYTALTNDQVWGHLVEALGSRTCQVRLV